MSDELSSKIEKLKDMLNNDNMSDNIKNIMSMMSDQSSEKTATNEADIVKIAAKIKKIIDKKNNISDPRVNLLTSIKPYLNSKRQSRIDSFVKLLNFTMISSIINDEDI